VAASTGGSTSGAGGMDALGGGGSGGGLSQPDSSVRVIAYLPNYRGSFGTWATQIDFTKMTHLNLAFALSNAQNGWDLGQSDEEVKAVVDAAHAAGVKVLPSLGGGGGDQSVIAQFNDAENVDTLVDNLDAFIKKFGFDGADVDIEDPGNVGEKFSTFVDKVEAKLRPQGYIVSAAIAQWVHQYASTETLASFDFVNIMAYSDYDATATQLEYFYGRIPDKTKLVAGAAFFGVSEPYQEWDYKEIVAADPEAWGKDVAQVQGHEVHYAGVATMQQIAQMSKDWGGIMFWEYSEDVSGDHSLWKAIQSTM
jgi:chitinase